MSDTIKWFETRKPLKLIFSDAQLAILKECKIANSEDNFQWFTKNVITPLVIILLPLLIQLIFPTNVKDYKALIFNGSLSLVGINILFGMSTYLIKVNQEKKKKQEDGNEADEESNEEIGKLNQDVIHLRGRLDDYKNILVLIGAAFYIYQALCSSYNSDLLFWIFLICSLSVLFLSILIGRFMFIIKDDFFEKTFYGELNGSVKHARNRWSRKY